MKNILGKAILLATALLFSITGTNVPQNMDSTPRSKLHGVSQSTYFLHNVNAYNEGALTRDMVPLRDGEKVGVIAVGKLTPVDHCCHSRSVFVVA